MDSGWIGLASALRLGILTSISPCPLAVKEQSRILLPSLYGLGTGLPVLVFAVLIALDAEAANRAFRKLSQCEIWARRVTGVIVIGVGICFCLAYIFRVL
jgi:cytochrome c-type biogenesis protein